MQRDWHIGSGACICMCCMYLYLYVLHVFVCGACICLVELQQDCQWCCQAKFGFKFPLCFISVIAPAAAGTTCTTCTTCNPPNQTKRGTLFNKLTDAKLNKSTKPTEAPHLIGKERVNNLITLFGV